MDEPADVPFATSVCHGCRFVRIVRSGKGSAFLMCEEPSLPKYQSQPLARCDRRVERPAGAGE